MNYLEGIPGDLHPWSICQSWGVDWHTAFPEPGRGQRPLQTPSALSSGRSSLNLEHFGQFEAIFSCQGEGREREIPRGWSGIPDTMGTFLSNFPLCCKWQRSRIHFHVSDCPGEFTSPALGEQFSHHNNFSVGSGIKKKKSLQLRRYLCSYLVLKLQTAQI